MDIASSKGGSKVLAAGTAVAGHLGRVNSRLPHLQLLEYERLQAQQVLSAQIHAQPVRVGHDILQNSVGSFSAG